MPKLPDAIHVVTAVRSRCRTILSADGGLRAPSGIPVIKPEQAGIAELLQQMA